MSIVNIKFDLKQNECPCCGRLYAESERTIEEEWEVDISYMLTCIDDDEIHGDDLINFVEEYLYNDINEELEDGQLGKVDKKNRVLVLETLYNELKIKNVTIIDEEFLTNYIDGK